jgi:hypothetical protein
MVMLDSARWKVLVPARVNRGPVTSHRSGLPTGNPV